MRSGPSPTAPSLDRSTAKRFLTVLVVLAVALPMLGGPVAAQDDDAEDDAPTVRQGDDCYTVTPYSGDESAKELYDYQAPFEDNPYVNTTGASYSSEGTSEIQRPNASTLFLYEDARGTLSLVIVHGANESTSGSGSATFNVTGLPEDGNWTVKDDLYNGSNMYDNWTHTESYDRINWTWDERRTDGGVYSGLGNDFNITIDPAFNEEAGLYGEHYNGTVGNWTALSGTGSALERTQLNLSEPVTISSEPCGE